MVSLLLILNTFSPDGIAVNLTSGNHKMVTRTLKILQHKLQCFQQVYGHFVDTYHCKVKLKILILANNSLPLTDQMPPLQKHVLLTPSFIF